MKTFLIGLATQHLGTKVLALILSMLVFVFVQSSITETREIATLTLDFQLAPELEGKYAVIAPNMITLPGVKIQGTQGVVGQDAKDLRVPRRVQVTEDFRGRWADEATGTIPITRALVEAQLEAGVSVVSPIREGVAVRLERLESRDARITIAPNANMELPEDFYVRGELENGSISPVVNVLLVRVTAPASLFVSATEKPVFYYRLPDVQAHLAEMKLTKEEEVVTLTSADGVTIDWTASGVTSPRLLEHMRWEAAGLGGTPLTTEQFVQQLQVSFKVLQKLKDQELDLPILVRIAQKDGRDTKNWKPLGGLLTTAAWNKGVAERIKVRMPQSLFLGAITDALVLVVDFSAATSEVEGELIVPCYLGLRESRRDQLENIHRIQLVTDERVTTFQPR